MSYHNKLMSCIVDNRREDNHAREEYGFVWDLFSIFFKSLGLKFPVCNLKRF